MRNHSSCKVDHAQIFIKSSTVIQLFCKRQTNKEILFPAELFWDIIFYWPVRCLGGEDTDHKIEWRSSSRVNKYNEVILQISKTLWLLN